MILKSLITNPLDQPTRPWKPWYGYLFLVIFVVAVGVYIFGRVQGGPLLPTATDPAAVYRNAKAALERQQAVPEVVDDSSVDSNATLLELARLAAEKINKGSIGSSDAPLPVSTDLAVPFSTQSPSSSWDEFHEGLAEEVAVLMVKSYFSQTSMSDSAQGEDDLFALVEAEKTFGYGTTLSVDELKVVADSYLVDLVGTVIENPTADDIKSWLAKGVPVIVPVTRSALANPFYVYDSEIHYLVIRGYDAENFVTNDPGTRRGEGYTYSITTIMDALSTLGGGSKQMFVLQKAE